MHRRRTVARALASLAVAGALLTACTAQPGEPVASPTSSSASAPTSEAAGPSRTVSLPTTLPPSSAATPTAASSTAAGVDAVPAVVRLAWLGKRPADPGVEITVTSGKRWQGPLPGEYALIKGSSRQWFGGDGSAVGCVSDLKCLGFDAEGNTAVLLDGKTRMVYRPDGSALGRFDAAGRRLAGKSLPPFAAAVADSGVDLAGLVDVATRPVPFAGGITGDPHLVTAGGRRYSTQLTGQYQARSGDPQRAVQVRLEPLPHQPNVSVVTAVAVGGLGAVLEFTSQGAATLDGAVLPAPRPFHQVSIPGGPDIGLWAADAAGTGRAVVVWPDGSTVLMSANAALGMTVVVQAPHVSGVSGLFGVGGIDPANDLQDRQGAALDSDTVARAWAVSGDDSLFGEQVEPVLGFPSALVTPPAQALPFAEKACRAAGVTVAEDLTACEFDVGLTGDDGFTAGHRLLAGAATSTVAAAFDKRFPALAIDPDATKSPLPDIIDAAFAAGQRRVYSLATTRPGQIDLEFVSGCRDQEPTYPAGSAAVRLFDEWGHAVSQRFAACGQPHLPALPAGRYYLVVAGPASGEPTNIRLGLHLP